MDYHKIGQKLKSVREKKGLSLHQIFEVTRIQANILKDIEKGQFKGSEIFLRNFIKTYSLALGLDFNKLMALKGEHSNSTIEEGNEPSKLEFPFFKQHKKHFKKFFFLGSGLLLTLLCLQWFFSKKATVLSDDIPLTKQEGPVETSFGLKQQEQITDFESKGKKQTKSVTDTDSEQLANSEPEQKTKPVALSKKLSAQEITAETQELKNRDDHLWANLKQSSFKHEVMIQSREKQTLYFKADRPLVSTKELEPWEWFIIKAKEFIYIRLDEAKTETQIFYNGQQLEIDSLKFFERNFQ